MRFLVDRATMIAAATVIQHTRRRRASSDSRRRRNPPSLAMTTVMMVVLLSCSSPVVFAFQTAPFHRRAEAAAATATARTAASRRSFAVSMVAKTGGKEILSENQFEQDVLSAQTEKPLMVFFTAPW